MNPSDSNPSKPGGLWARLFGVHEEEASQDTTKSADPAPATDWDVAGAPETPPPEIADDSSMPPLAIPVAPSESGRPPLAVPVATPMLGTEPAASDAPPLAVPVAAQVLAEEPKKEEAPPAAEIEICPICQAVRRSQQAYCDDCGWMFSSAMPARKVTALASVAAASSVTSSNPSSPVATMPSMRIKDRYELVEKLGEKQGVSRYRALDHGEGTPQPVVLLEAAIPEIAEIPAAEIEPAGDDFLPTFDNAIPVAGIVSSAGSFPGIAWEKDLLERAQHPALPRVVDHFNDNNNEYLVASSCAGRILWDAWDDPEFDAVARYGWLIHIAEALHALHQAGAVLEGLNPDMILVSDGDNQVLIADLSDLLPLPLPENAPVRATLYTAPELILAPQTADARADLYSFGAMIYALEYLHHALEEKDFERQFAPLQITERYPDVHPLFFRLISKTFVRDINSRFPTDEASRTDPTGFQELINTLEVCQRTFSKVRLDIAAWTTTGMVRTGNEDALSVLHAVDARQDDIYEYAIVLLADGMGGYEAGEVAAAMALTELKKNLVQQPMFSALAGKDTPAAAPFDVEACKKLLEAGLRHANREVYTASRAPGRGRRGMGCTAEAVYIDNQNIVVGHVGDSRTYHLHNGRLIQLTRDQTLVSRLVELGQLTEEEAESHPRRNELQQAIGGQPDVVPGTYQGRLKRGDWVLVCSDGLTNHIPSADLEKMLSREAAGSAEEAARRLLNLVNLRGATDNATIVVVRAS
ncbi:MAG: hypothetical protein FJ271_11315 [Planctomycetes bacterium]|nr:hypothetical protein [Planctomycetota bacterium]